MIIDIATQADAKFAEISRFACKVYAERFGVDISARPGAFAYAQEKEVIVGCLGLYLARDNEPLLFEAYVPTAFQTLSGDQTIDRDLCAEVGTRAVVSVPGFRSVDISLALSAALFMHAHAQGLRYLAFTSNRTVRAIVQALGLDMILLGIPDLSHTAQEFQKNWEAFFRVKQFCFGLNLHSVRGCKAALEQLKDRNIHSPLR